MHTHRRRSTASPQAGPNGTGEAVARPRRRRARGSGRARAAAVVRRQRQRLEVGLRHLERAEDLVPTGRHEAEPRVVLRVAEDDHELLARLLGLRQRGPDDEFADAPALPLGRHGDRRERQRLAVPDPQPGQQRVPDHQPGLVDGDQREPGQPGRIAAQRVHQVRLVRAGERGHVDASGRRGVLRTFDSRSDLHESPSLCLTPLWTGPGRWVDRPGPLQASG